jgi:hypothetical protein
LRIYLSYAVTRSYAVTAVLGIGTILWLRRLGIDPTALSPRFMLPAP